MITSIRLQNFRSFTDSAFEFEPKTNIIVGPNASGKTNLLEAVFYICSTRSFRTHDTNNIKAGRKWARIDGTTDHNQNRTIKLEPGVTKTKKTFILDNVEIKKISKENTIPVVLFEPNQLYQLTTSPETRRNFLDDLAGQIDPNHNRNIRYYKRALAQRNRLLKQKAPNINQLIFAWDIRLSELGNSIATERTILIKKLNESLSENYSKIAAKNYNLNLEYDSKLNTENYGSTMLKKLEVDIEKDMARGFTGVGPHRDDITISVDKQDIRNFASRGETRTTMLALKRCETIILRETLEKNPILLLDDVFSELDGRRRKSLTNFLRDYQTLITTTDADIIDKSYAQKSQLIKLK